MNIQSTVPVNNGIGVYLDAPITITFDTQLEASYATSSFFMMYRSDASYTNYYELIGLTITVDGMTLTLTPMVSLQQSSYYMLLVLGGPDGVKGIDGTPLPDNASVLFRTGTMLSPTATPITDVEVEPQVYIDATSTEVHRIIDSTDLFVQSGDIPIVYITSVPGNQNVGVTSVQKLVLIYDSEIDPAIDPGLLTGRWSELPIDPDPLTDKYITSQNVTVTGNKAVFDLPDMSTYLPSGSVNTEFTFTVPMYAIKGAQKKGYDTIEHRIKFAGKLEPLFATPDQIRKRLSGWSDQFNVLINDYDLYKLIHEKSCILQYVYELTPTTTADLIRLNQSTICMVLRDIVGMGTLLNGNIKARQILQDTITYENVDPATVLSELSKCINENTPEVITYDGVQMAMVVTGIKSGTALENSSGKSTKEIGVSKRAFYETLNYHDNLLDSYSSEAGSIPPETRN